MTVILLRHGRSSANTAGTLAGRTPGVALDETGRRQAAEVAERLAGLPIAHIVSSPLQRCCETVQPLADALGLAPRVDDALCEVDYGEWTGRPVSELVGEPLWRVVQQQPSAATFPGGECLADVQARSVRAIRAHDRRLHEEHGADTLWVACTHGDVIKAILADALGMHLDGFQRIATVPAAVSVIRYTSARPMVQHMNDTGSALDRLAQAVAEERNKAARAGVDPSGESGNSDTEGEGPRSAVPANGIPGGEV